jgi:hypothetical protein
VAADHVEAKGISAWILASPSDERDLVIARGTSEPALRLRGLALRDVLLDQEGKTALLLVQRGDRFVLEHLALDGSEPPQVLQTDLMLPIPVFGRSGDEAILMTLTHVLAVTRQGAVRQLFQRDDNRISRVARNASGSLFASARVDLLETVDPEGNAVQRFEAGRWPEFLSDDVLAFVQPGKPGSFGRAQTELVIAGKPGFADPALALVGEISRLRAAGDGELLFPHAPPDGEGRFWLLHWKSGIVRRLEPSDRGALRAAVGATDSRPQVADDSPLLGVQVHARAEPETDRSGFFRIDENGGEVRTAYEASGWDDVRHPEEARVHQLLLDRFLGGVQWPLRRERGYEAFFGSDDEPLRLSSSIRHLGLDVGARLMHVATGSVAFHAGGSRVYPVWRGGSVWFEVTASLREGESILGSERYRILQEVDLREGGYVLRVHVSYEHVKPAQASEEPLAVNADEALGTLEAFADDSPSGSWHTGDPALASRSIGKGNHVHLGIGGIFRSFNGGPVAGARKLRWYRERLIPALAHAPGPRG